MWRPQSWQDNVLHRNDATLVDYSDIEDKLQTMRERVVRNRENRQRKLKGLPSVEEEEAEEKQMATHQSVQSIKQGSEKPGDEERRRIQPDEIVIEFPECQVNELVGGIQKAFKLIWDGSISIQTSHYLASMANKRFVEALQELRLQTEQDEEPPVTFCHGA